MELLAGSSASGVKIGRDFWGNKSFGDEHGAFGLTFGLRFHRPKLPRKFHGVRKEESDNGATGVSKRSGVSEMLCS